MVRRKDVTELLAQLADVDVHRALVAVPALSPHGIEELAARQRQSAVGGEVGEEIELAGGEGDDFTVHLDLAPTGVDDQVTHLDHHRLAALGVGDPTGPPQYGAHPGHELAGRERLGDVIVGTELEAEDPIDLVVAGGEDDDRDLARGPHAAAHLEPVEFTGKSDVDDHHLGRCPARRTASPCTPSSACRTRNPSRRRYMATRSEMLWSSSMTTMVSPSAGMGVSLPRRAPDEREPFNVSSVSHGGFNLTARR